MKKFFKTLFQAMTACVVISGFVSCGKTAAPTAKAETIQKEAGKQGDFYVLSVNPEGELPAAVKNPSIQIMFSEPVVALERLGVPTDKNEFVSIIPAIKGHFKWIGTSLLSFECDEAIIPQREYFIQVNPETVSVKGHKISGTIAFGFYTAELKFTNLVAGYTGIEKNIIFPDGEVPTEYASDLQLYFSNNVNADFIKQFITIKSQVNGNEINYNFTAEQNGSNCLKIKITDPLQDKQKIDVTLKAGASSDKDSRPTAKDQTLSFHTLDEMKVNWTDLDGRSYGNYSNPVRLIFTHQIKENAEDEIIPLITTEPKMKISKENIQVSGTVLMIFNLPVTFDSEYKLTVNSGVPDIFGRKSERNASYNIQVPSARSYASFKDYGFHMLEAQFEPKLIFEYQNIIPDSSSYLVETVSGISRSFVKPEHSGKTFRAEDIKKDVRTLEPVELKQNLQYTADGFRGTIKFNADIAYNGKEYDWRSNNYYSKILSEKNEQYIQVTDLGLSVRYGFNKILVLVTKLSDGKPVEGAEVTPVFVKGWESKNVFDTEPSHEYKATTDKNGLAVINFKDSELSVKLSNYNLFIQAESKTDKAVFKPNGRSVYNKNWDCGRPYNAGKPHSVTFMFTDRGLYKPGEKVTFRGIDRTLTNEKYSPYAGQYYEIKLTESRWYQPKVIATETGFTSDNGTFWGTFEIPENTEPGEYKISYRRYESNSENESIPVQIQFFERLRFEVKASIPDAVTYYSGDSVSATVSGNYLGGGSLSGASVSESWTRIPAGFTAKSDSYKKLSFGPVMGYEGTSWLSSKEEALNGDGKVSAEIQTGGETLKGMAYTYTLRANVTDSGSQMISTSASVKVNPARFYIGLSDFKGLNGFAKKGDTLKLDYYCVTPDEKIPDSKAVNPSAKLKVELLRDEWKQVQQLGWNGEINTRYQKETVTESETESDIKYSGSPSEISIKPEQGGSYILRVSSKDKFDNEVISEKRFYVTSSDWTWFNREDSTEITMTADKNLYNPGEKAQILVNSPLPSGKYLMTIEREGIISEKVLDLKTASSVIEVPVEEDYIPNVFVTLSSYSVRKGKPVHDYSTPDLDKPKGYFGNLCLHVSTESKQFDITITPEKKNYRPAEDATIKIKALKNGKPVANAEITLMAVDRGVIDLINYHVADPVSYFYDEGHFLDYCIGGDSRELLIDPVTYEIRNLFGGDSADGEETKDQVRKNFEPTALFVPALVTDENGEAEVTFTLPDSLTSYRITAVGVDQNNFALAENEMPVTNPVSVRDVLPRQLRLNDEGEAGVVITNMTDEAKSVSVSLAIYSGLEKTGYAPKDGEIIKLPGLADISGETEKEVLVPANSTVPLMFMVKAQKQGWITVEYTIHSDVVNEKLEKPLQIEKPYIFETVASTGELRSTVESDSNTIEEMIKIPSDIDDGLGSLTVQLDPTRLGPLQNSVDYVFHYPYGCLEQRSAAILPLVAFGKYIKVLNLESEVQDVDAVIQDELNEWKKSQLSSGAFPYWPGSSYESYFVSARIGEICAIAQEKGYNVDFSEKLMSYIQNKIEILLNNSFGHKDKNGNYVEITANNIYDIAYGTYVITRYGSKIPVSQVDKITSCEYADIKELCFAGLSYIYLGQVNKANQVYRKIIKYISQTTQGVDITSINPDPWYTCFIDKNSENLADCLMFFSKLNSENQLNGKIVHSLLAVQNAGKGHYKSTSAVSRVFAGIDAYIQNEDLENLNFTAEADLDGKTFVSGKFEGLGAEAVEAKENFTDSRLKNIARDKNVPLKIKKDGKGTLYYLMSMKYAIQPVQQIARDEGICIFTEITDTQTGETVSGNQLLQNRIYKETVHISSTKDREYVAVRAPVPAGAEILNAAFATTGAVYDKSKTSSEDSDYEYDDYDSDYGYEEDYQVYSPLSHQAIYDSEVQYFWNWFGKGNQTVEFYFRPARKGTYNTPCTQAECMYEEEIFGRTKGNVWKIQ